MCQISFLCPPFDRGRHCWFLSLELPHPSVLYCLFPLVSFLGEYVRADCSDESSTKCNPCEDGTFNDVFSDRKQCLHCTSCAPDSGLRIARPCTRTRDAFCEPLEGFFCIESKGLYCEAAEKHSQCKPGQYIRDNGTALKDTVCADCSAGTFSDGTFTTCRPHTQCGNLLREGTASADAECVEDGSSINVTVGVVVVVIVLLVIFLYAGISGALYFRKKKRISDKRGSVSTQGEENRMIQPPV
ncbi:tumor necrosis factor receptor superfamily member 14-like isoform X2 [Solea solea]|uniref:tumor necrosis factor receptor superfamily member 14-like isoform X2 n=1 Tax=Solea solea TaxID=90069 RepID=UPI00272BF19C|nr:tumor necrosis factor receptor superfamily member 14-like isoform X2 [Solea solea]